MGYSLIQGLIREGLKGLSIVILDGLESRRQIVKAICRQIDKPYMPISPYHQSNGLSNLKFKTVYKDIPNIPYITYTLDRYKGLICKV